MIYQEKVLPKILTFSEIKYYIFSSVFVSLAIFIPWLGHQFHLVGPKFLLMHLFVLIAGFLFGWRTGFTVGFLSPLISYSVSHLPPISILPEITLELTIYGAVIGILRGKNINIIPALLTSMVLGRLGRVIFVLIFGLKTNPFGYFQMSWPGMLLQLALIPPIIFLLQRHTFNKGERE